MKSLVNGLFRPFRLGRSEYDEKLENRGIDPETGRLVPDPRPVAPPVGYKKQPSMVEIVREMVRSENLRREAAQAGYETFEESEDFDVGDEPDVAESGWENDFDPPVGEIVQEVTEERKKKAAKPPEQGSGGGTPPREAPKEPEAS